MHTGSCVDNACPPVARTRTRSRRGRRGTMNLRCLCLRPRRSLIVDKIDPTAGGNQRLLDGGSTPSTSWRMPDACNVFVRSARNARTHGSACASSRPVLQEDMPRRRRRSVARPHRTLDNETVCVEPLEAVDHNEVGEEREDAFDLRLGVLAKNRIASTILSTHPSEDGTETYGRNAACTYPDTLFILHCDTFLSDLALSLLSNS